MNVRAIALAVPLALGMACMHSQGQGAMGSASTAPSQQPQASAGGAGAVTQDPIMQPGPAVQGHAGDEIVAGRIADLGSDTISVETQQGGTRTLQVVPETDIRVDGRDASFQDLAQGQDIRASFDTVGGQDVAVKIHAGQLGASQGGTGSAPTDQGAAAPPAPGDQGTAPPPATDQGTATPPAPTSPPSSDTGAGQGASGSPRGW